MEGALSQDDPPAPGGSGGVILGYTPPPLAGWVASRLPTAPGKGCVGFGGVARDGLVVVLTRRFRGQPFGSLRAMDAAARRHPWRGGWHGACARRHARVAWALGARGIGFRSSLRTRSARCPGTPTPGGVGRHMGWGRSLRIRSASGPGRPGGFGIRPPRGLLRVVGGLTRTRGGGAS
jgi:hypothetical protein